jgi:hypothetical protein
LDIQAGVEEKKTLVWKDVRISAEALWGFWKHFVVWTLGVQSHPMGSAMTAEDTGKLHI